MNDLTEREKMAFLQGIRVAFSQLPEAYEKLGLALARECVNRLDISTEAIERDMAEDSISNSIHELLHRG